MKILFCTDGSKISFNALKNIAYWIKQATIDTICVIDWNILPAEITIDEDEDLRKVLRYLRSKK